jgi:hypothetical protein
LPSLEEDLRRNGAELEDANHACNEAG